MLQDLTRQSLDIIPVMLVALDTHGRITLINKRGCEILGYAEKELIGKDWFETCLPAAVRRQVRGVFDKIMRGEVEAVKYFDNPIVTKTGEERMVSWHNTVLRDDKGKPTGTLSSGLDITERKAAEERLRESEARVRAILETAVDGIITIDEHGIIESFNPAAERMFGYKAEEIVGKSVTLLMPFPYNQEHDGYIREYIETGERKVIGIGREIEAKRKDGTVFPVRLALSEVHVGEHRHFTGIIRDISEEISLRSKTIQAERLAIIGKMAAKVAHEIRNPLSSISLNAELLGEELDGYQCANTREARVLLESMIHEIDRVTALTDEYLQFSRLPHSRPVRGRLQDLLQEVSASVAAQLQHKGVKLTVETSDDLPEVAFDRAQLKRVLLNFIRNAHEAMPKGGELRIATAQSDHAVHVRISDTGVGIPEEDKERIFDPFFTTKDFGTGLGLAVSQQVINEHGGQIHCESEVGKGTTFDIELPLNLKRPGAQK